MSDKNINKCKRYDHKSQDRLPSGSGGGPRGCFLTLVVVTQMFALLYY